MSEPELLKFVKDRFEEYKYKFTRSNENEKEIYKKYLEFVLVLIDASTELANEKDHPVSDILIKDMIKFYFGNDGGPIDDPPNKRNIKKWFIDNFYRIELDSFNFDPKLFEGGRKNKRSIKRKTKRRKNKRRKTRKNKI
tara:strand:- start:181 stop:597 length:417 start_codon:yes stop_codon:yes gene_type:complete